MAAVRTPCRLGDTEGPGDGEGLGPGPGEGEGLGPGDVEGLGPGLVGLGPGELEGLGPGDPEGLLPSAASACEAAAHTPQPPTAHQQCQCKRWWGGGWGGAVPRGRGGGGHRDTWRAEFANGTGTSAGLEGGAPPPFPAQGPALRSMYTVTYPTRGCARGGWGGHVASRRSPPSPPSASPLPKPPQVPANPATHTDIPHSPAGWAGRVDASAGAR